MNSAHSQEETKNLSWKNSVRQAIHDGKFLGSTCKLYSKAQASGNSLTSKRCWCGRLPRRHSFNEEVTTELPADDESWDKFEHGTKTSVTVYGVWKNKTKVYFDKFQTFILFNLL